MKINLLGSNNNVGLGWTAKKNLLIVNYLLELKTTLRVDTGLDTDVGSSRV